MTEPKGSVSLDDIVQADRAKRRREALASKILGKGRRDSAPAGGSIGDRRASPVPSPSLASRMGVSKRPIPTGPRANAGGKWGHDPPEATRHRPLQPSRLPRTTSASTIERGSRIYADLRTARHDTVQEHDSFPDGTSNGAGMSGISIKGMAGPYTVIASNFAPGTTAADIEAVMAPVGGEMVSCKLVSSRPTVIAEMVFLEQDGAANVISMFNNKKASKHAFEADGRLLYVYMKDAPPHQFHAGDQRRNGGIGSTNRDLMDVDDDQSHEGAFQSSGRRAAPTYQDGSYGFKDEDGERGLVSDSMIRRGRFRR